MEMQETDKEDPAWKQQHPALLEKQESVFTVTWDIGPLQMPLHSCSNLPTLLLCSAGLCGALGEAPPRQSQGRMPVFTS